MTCQKIPFESKSEAKDYARGVEIQRKFKPKKAKSPKAGRKMRVYQCPICPYWHITTTKYVKKRQRKQRRRISC